ncbi:Glycosyltransferase Type 1 [Burkholderiales bacterium 8X]|nr:Glycosyltransferase Type 1 [Burkholderiales bacterium 8X]
MSEQIYFPAATTASELPRILFVQYSGDYLSYWERRQLGNSETYYGHNYILEQLDQLSAEANVIMMCCISGRAYTAQVSPRLAFVGANVDPAATCSVLNEVLERLDPTHLVVLGPLTKVLKWGIRHNVRVLCICADSFNISLPRRFYRYGMIIRTLNNPRIEWVANHGINATRAFARLGISKKKLICWDWPHTHSPRDYPSKTLAPDKITLVYVGALLRSKGLGDAIKAVACLRQMGIDVSLTVVGGGDDKPFKALSIARNIADRVLFKGVVSNADVLTEMRKASIVIVPSLHSYPEGFPLTIYEALCTRTPIVASDHPMFSGFLRHRSTAMIYPAGDFRKMSKCIISLLTEVDLYAKISDASETVWDSLQISTKWGELIRRWLTSGKEDREWLKERSLAGVTTG